MVELNKVKKEIEEVRREASNKTAGYIVTALGLVAGLAWNDAVKSLIETFFPAGGQDIWAKFIYAGALTIVVVIISVWVVKVFKVTDKNNKKSQGKK